MEQYKCTVIDLGFYDSEKSVLIEVNEDSDEIEISTVVDGIDFFSSDIVNIGLHFFLKNVRPYAASCSES